MSKPSQSLPWTLSNEDDGDRGRLRPKYLTLLAPAEPEENLGEILVHKSMSLDEFLAFERESTHKHEYVGGRVYAMAGASDAHNAITVNLIALLLPLARAAGCRVYSADMKVQIDDLPDLPDDKDHACYYPDVMVSCSVADKGRDIIKKEPIILVEVLSPRTSGKDRGDKLEHYCSIATLQQYWLISKDRCHVDVYERDGSSWKLTTYRSLDATIAVPELNGELRLSDVYEDVQLPGRTAS